MDKDYFFGLDIIYVGAIIFFIIMMIYLFRISRKRKKEMMKSKIMNDHINHL